MQYFDLLYIFSTRINHICLD